MSEPLSRDVALIIAGYPTVDLATEDWHVLKEAKSDEDVRMYDLAVVEKAADGSAKVVKNLHHKVRGGLIVGGVLALVTPLGLAAGLIGGAAAGKIASHFHKGIAKRDITGLGELATRNPVLLVALTEKAFGDIVAGMLSSDDVVAQSMTTDHAEFDRLLTEHDSGA
jgi:uncharacterized membrane protein